MVKKIVLLDVDGVLIHAGYRQAVKKAVEYLASQMGQPHIQGPTEADMVAFEAHSIIFEWDSAAISLAALLQAVPEIWQNTLAETMTHIRQAGITLSQPDYQAIADQCHNITATQAGEATIGTIFPDHPLFREILTDTHSINAPITKIIQQFVLGSDQYARTYQLKPQVDTPSMLEQHDTPLLSVTMRDRLYDDPDVYPVIYTARPSLPPSFEPNWLGYSPEAEIAQKVLDFHQVPLIAYGKMQWLAKQNNVPDSSYVKPSPMQGMVAIFSALLFGSPNWEQQAYTLAQAEPLSIPTDLKDQAWHIIVCEDSPSSIGGVRQAAEQLAQNHLITFQGVGIATHATHITNLERQQARVYPNINDALAIELDHTD